MSDLGLKVLIARKKKGLSQKDLADRLGCKPTKISRIENGKYVPKVDYLKTLADELGTTLDDLTAMQREQNAWPQRKYIKTGL